MRPKKISFKTTQAHQNRRLDQVLSELLPDQLGKPLSKGKVRKLIVAGAVYLNGKRVRIASKELMPNARIEVYVDLERLLSDSRGQDEVFEMDESRILYEDDTLIAINKPPGLPTQPTLDEARDNLFVSVKKYLAKREGKALPQIYLGLHHRLDRDTSGVLLFTKTADVNKGVSEIFTAHLAQKTYYALAFQGGEVKRQAKWTVKNYLGKAKTQGKRSKFQSVRSGGDFAQTEFKVLENLGAALLIEAKPKTGRTHQIRVHLSEDQMPILGDLTYGGPTQVQNYKVPRLMLHAAKLEFPHPVHKAQVIIQCPLPEDFEQCLKVLQRRLDDF